MLKTFLRIAHNMDIKTEPKPGVANRLLKQALDYVCDDVCGNSVLREHMSAYRGATPESQRYAPFVLFCNAALERMKNANLGEGFRSESPLNILFARNDPQLLMGTCSVGGSGKTMGIKLKPDVIVTSLVEARKRLFHPRMSWENIAKLAANTPQKSLEALSKPPKRSIGWDGMMAFGEFKLKRAPIQTKLKAGYVSTEAPAQKSLFDTNLGIYAKGVSEVVSATSVMKKRAADAAVVGNDTPVKKQKVANPQSNSHRSAIHVASLREECKHDYKLPAAVQAGIYGANMISRPGVAAHAIGFVVEDEWIWLWWYDRQGPIQVAAINFLEDLPRFLVLLLCIQRFNLEDWGFIPELDPRAKSTHLPGGAQSKTIIEYTTCIATLEKGAEALRFCLRGRGTSTAILDNVQQNQYGPLMKLPPWMVSGEGDRFHLKVAWIDDTRESEAKILETLREKLKDPSNNADYDNRISHHLPWVVDSKEHGISTGTIRATFNFKVTPARQVGNTWVPVTASRILCSLLTEKLDPVEVLSSLEYFKVHLDIAGCAFGCWSLGVGHRDPSLSNFMWRKIDGKRCGVLNDYDLSVIEGSRPSGLERTGTIPYMALELLMNPSGSVSHQFKHDLEATYWVLSWMVYCSPDPGGVPEHFDAWRRSSYTSCSQLKSGWQHTYYQRDRWRKGWKAVQYVWRRLRRHYDKIMDDESDGPQSRREAEPESSSYRSGSASVSPEMSEWVEHVNMIMDAAWKSEDLKPHKYDYEDEEKVLLGPVAKAFALRWKDYGVSIHE